MGFNTKALHYCGTHTHVFLKKNCKHCGQGMCVECIEKHEHYCPECTIELQMQTDGYKAKKKVLYATMTGVIFLGFYLIYWFIIEDGTTLWEQWWRLLFAFGLGVSAASTYFLLRNSNDFHDMGKLPFFGLKLYFLIPIVFTLTLIPVVFYLYWILEATLNIFKKEKF